MLRRKLNKRGDIDADLREDIRLLGRLLGDTIRDQAGTDVFDLVERIRRTAIHYRKEHDLPSLKTLERTIGGLGAGHATNVVRAFSYFHHLANAAEDLHKRRGEPEEGSIAVALERLRAAHVPTKKIVSFFERARVEPVLTAHPTEVQRKSTLDRHRAVIDLLAARGEQPAGEIEAALRREVLLMWKTNELRLSKPTVADEIENGLTYFRSTFLEAIPRLYAEIEDGIGPGTRLAPFLRVASWIGGDRDGNPHVTADVTEHAAGRQASVAFTHYLAQIHALGAELSLSSRYTATSPELQALAARSPDRGTSRDEEPYRRALVGIYARVAATARALGADAGTLGTAAVPARAVRRPGRAVGRSGRDRDRAGRRRRGAGRRRAAAQPPPRRRRLRVSPLPAGSAPAQRGPRTRRLRAARARHGQARLRDAGRVGAPGAVAARAVDLAAAGLAARRPTATRRRRRWRRWRRPRACAPASASARSRTTSSR